MHRKLHFVVFVLLFFPPLVIGSDFGQAAYRSLADQLGQALLELTDRAANAESRSPPRGDGTAPVPRASSLPAIQQYFPLHNGDYKNYSWRSINISVTYLSDTFNGHSVFNEIDSADGSSVFYGYANDQLLLYGAVVDGAPMVLDTPLAVADSVTVSQGGSFRFATSGSFMGYRFQLSGESVVTNAGTVTVPAGTFFDCRNVSMSMTLSVLGTTESVDLRNVWVLAPRVGKIRIGVMDQFLNRIGWADLTGGTVNGVNVQNLTGTDNPSATQND